MLPAEMWYENTNELRFSVIVTSYNEEEFIAQALESVLCEKSIPLEVICVDDGSMDSSWSIINAISAKDSRLRIVRKANEGVSIARNLGMEMAVGEYVLFLDGDDELTHGALQGLNEMLQEKDVDVVAFNSVLLYVENGKIVENMVFNHTVERVFETGAEYYSHFVKRRQWGPTAACFYAYKRLFLKRAGVRFLSKFYYEDEMFVPQVFMAAGRCLSIPLEVYCYRQRPNSITKIVTIPALRDKYIIASSLFSILKEKVGGIISRRVVFSLLLSVLKQLEDIACGLDKNGRKGDSYGREYLRELFIKRLRRRVLLGLFVNSMVVKDLWRICKVEFGGGSYLRKWRGFQ